MGIVSNLSVANPPHTAAALFGLSAAFAWLLVLFSNAEGLQKSLLIMPMGIVLVTGSSALFVYKDTISKYLSHPSAGGGVQALVEPGFIVEEFADTSVIPIRVAVSPDNRVFVTGQVGVAAQSGAVVRIDIDESGTATETYVANELNRPYGLVAMKDRLIVSRSGQQTRWSNGRPTHFPTGAVTELRDLDGDGIMEHYDDIAYDLPGARGPDYLHQNSAVVVAEDGTIYVTSGNSSDAHPPRHQWGGTILRIAPDGERKVDVFARGLRNTFGLAFGPEGALFATDNDAQSGLLAHLGDKLVDISMGDNFGHPYATEEHPEVKAPLYRSEFSLGGLAYTDSSALPERFRQCLYVVSYGSNKILRFRLRKEGERYVVSEPEHFATIQGAVDIAISRSGEMYVVAYPDRVMRIRYVGT